MKPLSARVARLERQRASQVNPQWQAQAEYTRVSVAMMEQRLLAWQEGDKDAISRWQRITEAWPALGDEDATWLQSVIPYDVRLLDQAHPYQPTAEDDAQVAATLRDGIRALSDAQLALMKRHLLAASTTEMP